MIDQNETDRNLVYRVNWLRAKARYDRWGEEIKTLKDEMIWTLLFFNFQRKEWEKRATMTKQGGHKAYALRQAAI